MVSWNTKKCDVVVGVIPARVDGGKDLIKGEGILELRESVLE